MFLIDLRKFALHQNKARNVKDKKNVFFKIYLAIFLFSLN